MENKKQSPEDILLKYWGYPSFRPGQREIIDSIIDNRETLAILTTGGGKSICYQVPGLLFTGLTVVVSPLISLMQDQVGRLKSQKIEAVLLNSAQTREEKALAEDKIFSGRARFLYVSPESLVSSRLQRLLSQVEVSMVAVDEAHCISVWGHDFRPEYLRIAEFIDRFKVTRIAAFTATATTRVRADITRHLGMRSPEIFLNSFARENLSLRINSGVFSLLGDDFRCAVAQSPIIIYAATRKRCEEIAEKANEHGYNAGFYHGGMGSEQRAMVQDDFLDDKFQVIAATNAFGMGVDKANIRNVFHDSMPDSLENYYQEAGRAGRDGEAATCHLYFNWRGVNMRRSMLEDSYPDPQSVNKIYNYLRKNAGILASKGIPFREILLELSDINQGKLGRVLELLTTKQVIRPLHPKPNHKRGQIQLELLEPNIIFLGRYLRLDKYNKIYKVGRDKLAAIINYCQTDSCRQKFILNYFGENYHGCGICDNCLDKC